MERMSPRDRRMWWRYNRPKAIERGNLWRLREVPDIRRIQEFLDKK